MQVLPGRQLIAFPDLGACDRWRKKAKDYSLLDITVSDYLKKNATPQQREIGADLADLVVEERMGEGELRNESAVEKDNMIIIQNGTRDPLIDKSSRSQ